MTASRYLLRLAVLVAASAVLLHPASSIAEEYDPVAVGERMYRDGLLPSGELMSGLYAGDVSISGEQVIC